MKLKGVKVIRFAFTNLLSFEDSILFRGDIMQKKLFRIISMALMVCLLATAFPLNALAEGANSTELVTYYTDSNNVRTGIKEINLAPNTYYDCSNNTAVNIDTAYLSKVLDSNVEVNSIGNVNILDEWAHIAGAIFENGGKYTCTDDYSTCYGKNYSTSTKENCYIAQLLADSSAKSGGSIGKDNYRSTGLSVASSLSALRTKMGNEIADCIDRKICSGSDILGQGDNCDDALPDFKDDTQRTVIYNMATSIARSGSTAKFKYNSYCVAFYDFDLMIIADDNIEYVTDAESLKNEENPVEAAEQQGVEGFAYSDSNDVIYLVGSENYSTTEANKQFSLDNTSTESISTSLQNSESFSFEQSIGSETEFDSTLKGIVGGVTETFKVSFTTGQSFGTAFTEENSYSESTGTTDIISVALPPQTVGYIQQGYGNASMTIPYDVPVALTFKVAVFSMSGDVYADKVAVLAFSTAGYKQSYFSTVFGGDSAEEGFYAYESLYNRYANKSLNGWEGANGNNHIFYKKHDGSSSPTDTSDYSVNWDNVENTFKNNTSSNKSINATATTVPMLASGATTTVTSESYSSVVYDYLPMYLPTYLKATNLESFNFTLFKGGVFNLSSIGIDLCNKNGVSYYGFKYGDGHWELCEGSENVLQYNAASNAVVAKNTGVGSVKYVINDDVQYTAEKETGTATTDEIAPLTIMFAVYDNPFTGRASAQINSGEDFKGTVGDEPRYLSELMEVVDENGNEINNCAINWEAEDDAEGISIDDCGKVSFEKEGTYKIRAVINPESTAEYTTDWVEVTPRAKRVIADAEFDATDLENLKLNFKYFKNSKHHSQINLDINSLVTFYDQYGDKYLGESADILVSVDKQDGCTVTADNKLVISEEGKYNITVSSSALSEPVIGTYLINVDADIQHEIGDLNGDNYRTIKDATLVQKYLAKLVSVEDILTENADVNEDGRITISDATAIQKYLAKIIE